MNQNSNNLTQNNYNSSQSQYNQNQPKPNPLFPQAPTTQNPNFNTFQDPQQPTPENYPQTQNETLLEKIYNEKIDRLPHRKSPEYFRELLDSKFINNQKAYLRRFKMPYDVIMNDEKEQLFLYLGLNDFKYDFEPEDVYEVYSLANMNKMYPVAAQFLAFTVMFYGSTQLFKKSMLYGLTWENCFRCRLAGFLVLPMSAYYGVRSIVRGINMPDIEKRIDNYDLRQQKYIDEYKEDILGLEIN